MHDHKGIYKKQFGWNRSSMGSSIYLILSVDVAERFLNNLLSAIVLVASMNRVADAGPVFFCFE